MKKAPVKFVKTNNAIKVNPMSLSERTGDRGWGIFIQLFLLTKCDDQRTPGLTTNYRIFWFTTIEEVKSPAIRP
jgi:hypothetical protein